MLHSLDGAARNNNEATRRDRLFRDFIAMEAPVVPPALVRTTQWGFGNSVAPSAGGAPSIWGNTSAQGSRSGLHRARSGIGTRGGVVRSLAWCAGIVRPSE